MTKKLQNYSPRLGTVIVEAFSLRKRNSRRCMKKKKIQKKKKKENFQKKFQKKFFKKFQKYFKVRDGIP